MEILSRNILTNWKQSYLSRVPTRCFTFTVVTCIEHFQCPFFYYTIIYINKSYQCDFSNLVLHLFFHSLNSQQWEICEADPNVCIFAIMFHFLFSFKIPKIIHFEVFRFTNPHFFQNKLNASNFRQSIIESLFIVIL